jgi:dTDP-glucose pyrophosphorylase
MQRPTLLILAAGMGSRYGGLKQLDTFGPGGEAIIDYSIYDAIQAGFGKIVFVIRKSLEADFRERFDSYEDQIHIDYVFQELDALPEGFNVPEGREKPWGTGHAVMVAADKIDTPFALINADDFYGGKSFKLIADFLKDESRPASEKYAIVAYKLENTLSDNGHVNRGVCQQDDSGYLTDIHEVEEIQRSEDKIIYPNEAGTAKELKANTLVSMNLMGFPAEFFQHIGSYFHTFLEKRGTELKSEFYIPFVVDELIKAGKINMKVLPTNEQWIGVTYQEDRAVVKKRLESLVKEGVYPERLRG